MNVLIVLAHPEPQSFNHGLAQTAARSFCLQGHDVRISDLYAQKFNPVEQPDHFLTRKDPSRFDAQTEQRFSAEQKTLPEDVCREVENILWADTVIFQFPLWWFGLPAILKGWMDRVFVYGALYSGSRRRHTGVCRGKRAVFSVTAGSPMEACAYNGQEGDTSLILWPAHYALHYVGFSVLEPRIIMGVRGGISQDDAREQTQYLDSQMTAHRDWAEGIHGVPEIQFNGASDWDEHRKLKPEAPVYSPFIRHQEKLRSN
ncbi:NAD(P)H dehydrogenase (quinone) [Gluconobacter thailandicus F149-1 = NBRC 100600]|nr:NAD(P)H-dependent oxidoreductase [Gluconobacter thailandicus]GAN94403.1 NAD(P)H dehydrogenase (quinone) [Gluconobacter thailandicus F149-1 = NBRC 100600]GEL88685.1 NAD(P)H dehydrogenase [Gluconobacter thailandicus F149-1 = NBRC 100600]